MSLPIIYVDTCEMRPGKLERLETAMTRLADFVEANVPRLDSYAFFLDEARTRMAVVAVHPDSASLALHRDTGSAELATFADLIELVLIELVRIEVCGRVLDAVMERLHLQARMLRSGGVTMHGVHAGFAR